MTRLVFLDTETTGLDPRTRLVWDVGLIVRDDDAPDVEHQWFVDVSLKHADPASLRIGGYYERHPSPWRRWDDNAVSGYEVAARLAELLHGATVVGAVPWFDMHTIEKLLRRHTHAPTWHYHLVDVEALAAGALKLPPPWNFDRLLAEYGLTYDEADRHTAIGDARMVRDLFDRVLGGAR